MQRLALCTCLGSALFVGLVLSNASTPPSGIEASQQEASTVGDAPKHRSVRFTYGATLTRMKPGSKLRVWMPVPRSGDHQTVQMVDAALPVTGSVATEPKFGNKILSFEVVVPETGITSFSTRYDITRKEVRGLKDLSPADVPPKQLARFLEANRMVPTDKGKQLDLLSGVDLESDPLQLAKSLYERVDQHVKYDKTQPGYGNGDVAWVCDSRTGNCTDFHSLFISLARSQALPARFEIGFPLPPRRGAGAVGGYHCWAMFHIKGKGWVPVDISEADKHPEMKDYYFGNLTENRIGFSVGRDIVLAPKQSGPPLNYFVYPYAEVDGQPVPKEQIKLRFAFEDAN